VKDLLNRTGPEGIYKMASATDNRNATASCVMYFVHDKYLYPEKIRAKVEGTIVEPRGTGGYGFDS
jgi:inosine triphosphate pyrophosphatase